MMSATIVTQQYFNKKRGLANGIILAGGGLAIFVIPPIVAYITDHFGWRASFILQSGLALQSVPAAMLLRPMSPAKQNMRRTILQEIAENIAKSCQCKLLRIPAFTVLLVGTFLFYFAHETPIIFSVARAMSQDIARQQASFVMSSLAATSIPARVLIGWVGDKVHRGVLISIAVLAAGATHVISILCRSLTSHLIYGAIYGIFAGRLRILHIKYLKPYILIVIYKSICFILF